MRHFLNTFRKIIKVAPRHYSAIDAELLEDRILMSAMPMVDANLVLDDSLSFADSPFPTMSLDSTSIIENQAITSSSTPAESDLPANQGPGNISAPSKRLELVFVNTNTPNYQALLDDLLANSDNDRDFEVYLLDANRDGIEQISSILNGYANIDAIHLVSHAENSAIQFGNTWLSSERLSGYAGQFVQWQSSLASDADILIYGCDLASTASGRDFIDAVSALTGADVAASVDDTGHSQWGANWVLEYHVGTIESGIAFSESFQQAWQGKLATITVTTFSDVVNGGDGVLSLREAIIQANGGSGGDTIVLSAGTYTLNRTGTGEDNASTGDLDIRQSVTITGATAATTIINGNGIDRVFHVAVNNITISMSDLTIQGGSTTQDGGGVFVEFTNDQLNLSRVVITGNIAVKGAGIFSEGTLNLTDVVISNNGNNTTTQGGGLHNRENATLNRVSIHDNQADEGGGIYEDGQNLSLTNVTISGNTANIGGGGISNMSAVIIFNSTIANNTATQGGGIRNAGGTITMTNTIVAGNSATSGGADFQGVIVSQGKNIVQNTLGASGFVASDITGVSPMLDALADNGGGTQTHALLAGSVAIGNGIVAGAPSVDQRGVYRIGIVDIGAFEYTPTLTSTGEQIVNQTTGSNQVTSAQNRGSQRAVSVASDGSYAVVWSSQNQDGAGWGIYARRFNSAGMAITNEILVNQTTSNDQKWARVASADNGNFVVTWSQDIGGDPGDVYFRMFAANGTALGAEQRANNTASNLQANSVIAMDQSTGQFVIAWQGEGPGDTASIFFRRFAANGTALDATDQLANTAGAHNEQDAAIAMQTNGAFVIAWERTNTDKIFFQRFDGTGAKVGSETQIDNSLSTSFGVDVASDDAGNFTFTYREQSILPGVWKRGFNADGTQRYTWSQVASGDAVSPSITMLGDGSHIITWQKTGDGDGWGVYAQRFNANGSANGAAFLVNQTTTGTQSQPSVSAIDFDNFVIAWSGAGTGDSEGVFVRQYNLDNLGNSAPTITSNGGLATASTSIAENTTAVTTVVATDANTPTQTLTYSISGGIDSAKFAIDSLSGALSFIAAPNFEAPTDIGANNVYDVIVRVSDGTLTDSQTLAITVTNVNDPPVSIGDNYTLQEDGAITTRSNWFNNAWSHRSQISFNNATGPVLTDQVVLVSLNASNIDYSLTQNSGQDLRFVDTDGTVLSYEIDTWNEAGTSTVWVRVPQINAASTTDSIWMYYGNAAASAGQNANGVWSSNAQAILHLNGTLVDSSTQANTVTNGGTASATGYISGGRTFDGVSNEINLGSSTAVDDIFNGGGTLSTWIRPTGWGENGFGRIADKASTTFAGSSLGNGWALQVNGTDGSLIFEQGHSTTTGEWRTAAGTISLNVWQHIAVSYDSSSPSNAPQIFIDGVQVVVTTTKTPAGTAGSDAALNLKIGNHSVSTVRTFDGAIDEFQLYNTALTSSQILANYQSMSGALVSIGSPQSGPGGVLMNDSDAEGTALSVTLGAGPIHQQSFTLNADGSFTYIPVANYSGSDSFTYFVSDGTNSSGPITVTLTIAASNDTPTITSNGGLTNASISLGENIAAVTTVTTSDPDLPAQILTYSLTGGTDQNRFAIHSSSGALTFLVAPNYESPNDSDGNRTYEVIVTVSDSQGGFDSQTIVVTILDANEFSPSTVTDSNSAQNTVNENSTTGTLVGFTAFATDGDGTNNTITYSLTNSAGGRFAIGSASGVVTVGNGTLLDRESAASHSITVRATSSDGSFNEQVFSIAVADVDEFDVGTVTDNNGTANSVNENATSGTLVGITASATDADATTNAITYSLDDTASGRFAIHSASGVVTVANSSLLDYESNAQHNITVRATSQDGSVSTRTFAILIANVNDNQPLITSSNAVSINENQLLVLQLTAIDADLPAQNLSFSIAGGPDGLGFDVTSSNQLVFRRPPNFENPRDSNSDNVYSVTVFVSDGAGGTATQLIHVTVTNINEAPSVLSPTMSLLQTDVLTSDPGGVLVGATDPEGDALSVTLVSTTSNGQLIFASDGSFTYTPGADYLGIDSFTFEVSDGAGGVTQGTVTLVISPGFIPPTPELPQGTTIPDDGSNKRGESPSEPSTQSQERSSNSSEEATIEASSSNSGSSTTTPQITSQTQVPLKDAATPSTDRNTASATTNSNEFSKVAAAARTEKGAAVVRLGDSAIEYRIIREFARQASVRAAEQAAQEVIQRIDLVLHDGLLWNDLNHLREQISSVSDATPITMGTATGVASGLSVGYVMWLLRGGYIVAGVMAQLPAWGLIDPLPILSQLDDLDDDDDDSLASMVDKSNSNHDSKLENEGVSES